MMYVDAPANRKLPIPDREMMKHFGPNIWPKEQDMEEMHKPFTLCKQKGVKRRRKQVV